MSKVGTGKPGPGRPPGASNKITRDIREAILKAFEDAGGAAYLKTVARDNPQVFCALLGKVLPTQVEGSLTVTHHEDALRALGRG